MAKTREPWEHIELTITIQSDDMRNIFDINISNGYKSVSYYGEQMPTIKDILEDFD